MKLQRSAAGVTLIGDDGAPLGTFVDEATARNMATLYAYQNQMQALSKTAPTIRVPSSQQQPPVQTAAPAPGAASPPKTVPFAKARPGDLVMGEDGQTYEILSQEQVDAARRADASRKKPAAVVGNYSATHRDVESALPPPPSSTADQLHAMGKNTSEENKMLGMSTQTGSAWDDEHTRELANPYAKPKESQQ